VCRTVPSPSGVDLAQISDGDGRVGREGALVDALALQRNVAILRLGVIVRGDQRHGFLQGVHEANNDRGVLDNDTRNTAAER